MAKRLLSLSDISVYMKRILFISACMYVWLFNDFFITSDRNVHDAKRTKYTLYMEGLI